MTNVPEDPGQMLQNLIDSEYFVGDDTEDGISIVENDEEIIRVVKELIRLIRESEIYLVIDPTNKALKYEDYPQIHFHCENIATRLNCISTKYDIQEEWIFDQWIELFNNLDNCMKENIVDWIYYEDMEFMCSIVRAKTVQKQLIANQQMMHINNASDENNHKKSEKKSRFGLAKYQISIIEHVEPYTFLYDKSSNDPKTRQARLDVYKAIGNRLKEEPFLRGCADLGKKVSEEWVKIRRNYSRQFNAQRQTPYDELFAFLIPYIKTNNKENIQSKLKSFSSSELPSTSRSTLRQTVNQVEDRSSASASTIRVLGNIDLNDRSIVNNPSSSTSHPNRNSATSNELSITVDHDDEDNTSNSLQRSKCVVDRVRMDDPYNLALAQAFSEEIPEEKKMEAMLHLCKKITDFVNSCKEDSV